MSFPLSSLYPVLAAGDGFVIFIIVAIIYGIAKFVAFINKKTETAANSEEGLPEDMGELIKRVLQQNKQQSRSSTPSTPSRQEPQKKPVKIKKTVPYTQPPASAPAADPKAADPVYTPAPMEFPSTEFPSAFEPVDYAAKEAPAPAPAYVPMEIPAPNILNSDDIEARVQRMAMDVEASAQATIDAAYSSAQSGYQQTLNQLNKLKQEIEAKAAATSSQSVTPSKGISFHSKADLKNAVLMKEILDTPKGMR